MKRIAFDPFDVRSIGMAIIALKEYQNWVKDRVNKLCEILAKEYALYTVAEEFRYTEGGNVACYVEEIPNGYRIVAEGEPVFFLEYGTGPAAGTGPYLGSPPVSTHPGSYSDSVGKGKYGEWVDGGMQGPFRWTLEPRAGMYFAFQAATEGVQRVAKEVFNS